jgi:hypothetical protein
MGRKMSFFINDEKWAEELQTGLEEYMMRCQDSIDEDEEFETLSGLYYCGCNVCYYRETLAFMAPKIIIGEKEGKIQLDA